MVSVPPHMSETGKRQQRFFRTQKEAERHADDLTHGRATFGDLLQKIDQHQLSEAVRAIELLRPANVGLLEAVQAFLVVLVFGAESVEVRTHGEVPGRDEGFKGIYWSQLSSRSRDRSASVTRKLPSRNCIGSTSRHPFLHCLSRFNRKSKLFPCQITQCSTRQFPRNNVPLNLPRSHEKPWRGTNHAPDVLVCCLRQEFQRELVFQHNSNLQFSFRHFAWSA
jgi:hypothetical protein